MSDLPILEVRFEDYQHYHEKQHDALKEQLEAKEHALKEQLEAKEHALDRRLEGMNEFREEARTVQNTYLRRDLWEQQHSLLCQRASDLEGTLKGIYLGLGLTFLTAVVTLVWLLFKGKCL